MIKDLKKDKFGLYILSKDAIESEVENILKDYNDDLLIEPQAIDLDDFTENYLHLNMEYQSLSPDKRYYGLFVFTDGVINVYDENNNIKPIQVEKKTVILDSSLSLVGENTRRFSLGHEDGHYIWHYGLNNKENLFEKYDKHKYAQIACRSFSKERKELKTKEDWQEWQANYTSACLLANRTAALKIISKVAGYEVKYNSGFMNKLTGYQKLRIKHLFTETFKMSEISAFYRMKELSDSKS